MVQTEYCVILCRRPFEFYQPYPRTRRFYVGAPTADDAILAASDTLPHYRPIGVELSDLPSFQLDSFVEFPGARSPARHRSNRGLAGFADALRHGVKKYCRQIRYLAFPCLRPVRRKDGT
jgi:hypothetical protein